MQKSTYDNMADELEDQVRNLLTRKDMMNRDMICLKVAQEEFDLEVSEAVAAAVARLSGATLLHIVLLRPG